MAARKRLSLALIAATLMLPACGDDDKTEETENPSTQDDDGDDGADADSDDSDSDDQSSADGPQPDGGSDDTDDADGVDPVATGCEAIDLAAPSDGVQYQMPLSVPAYEEREYCMLVKLDHDLNLNWSDGRYTNGSHHALIERTSYKDVIPTTTITGETVEDATKPHPCITPSQLWDTRGVVGNGRPVKMGDEDNTQSAKGVLPDNVAYKFKKGEIVLLNFHMINTTDKPIDSCFKVNLHGIPEEKVEQEAGTLFFYNIGITVPANGESTAHMACPITQDIKLGSAVSHMHARGDGYTAGLLDKDPAEGDAKVVKELYTGTKWEDPDTRLFDGALDLTQGQWIDFSCHYTNHEDRNVAQGFASTDEMCMFIGAYWPRNLELEECARPGLGAGSAGYVYGNGDKDGQDFLECYSAIPPEDQIFTGTFDDPKRYATLSCFTNTCEEASTGTRPYLSCLEENAAECQEQCSIGSFTAACSIGECADEYAACTAAIDEPAKQAAKHECASDYRLQSYQTECDEVCTAKCTTGTDEEKLACKTACIGTPEDAMTCVGAMSGSCVQDTLSAQVKECASTCFEPCVHREVTECVGTCLNGYACADEYNTLLAAECTP